MLLRERLNAKWTVRRHLFAVTQCIVDLVLGYLPIINIQSSIYNSPPLPLRFRMDGSISRVNGIQTGERLPT